MRYTFVNDSGTYDISVFSNGNEHLGNLMIDTKRKQYYILPAEGITSTNLEKFKSEVIDKFLVNLCSKINVESFVGKTGEKVKDNIEKLIKEYNICEELIYLFSSDGKTYNISAFGYDNHNHRGDLMIDTKRGKYYILPSEDDKENVHEFKKTIIDKFLTILCDRIDINSMVGDIKSYSEEIIMRLMEIYNINFEQLNSTEFNCNHTLNLEDLSLRLLG